MGHDLLGNELGPGIRQLASGKYAAFYKRNDRRRVQRSFSSLEECKDWMTRHGRYMISGRVLNNPETLTVEKWLESLMREIALETENPSCEGTVLHHEEGMDLLPSSKLLTGMELWLQTVDKKETVRYCCASERGHKTFARSKKSL